MRVAFFGVQTWEKNYLAQHLKGITKEFYKSPLTARNAHYANDCEIISIFINSRITPNILERLPKLKRIITRSTGFDHIDVDACKKRGVRVANVPSYGDNTVAEHTFALILAVARKLVPSIEKAKRHNYDLRDVRGFDLKEKTLGIVGCGKIGQNVARIARGFQMRVLVFDLNKDQKLAKKIGFTYVSLSRLFKESDIISLHVPFNKHTRHMINTDTITTMKDGVVIINTARGGIINTDHLIAGLRSGKIRAAGLDVLESEAMLREESQLLSGKFSPVDMTHLIENNILLTMDNVVVTPHNAFNSEEAVQRILDTTIACVKHTTNTHACNVV